MMKGLRIIIFFALLALGEQGQLFFRKADNSKKCITAEGLRGFCVTLQSCPKVRQALENAIRMSINYRPKHCGFRGHTPIVCCHNDELPTDLLPPPIKEVPIRPSPPIDIIIGLHTPPIDGQETSDIRLDDAVIPPKIEFECGLKGISPPPPPSTSNENNFSFFVIGGLPADENEWRWMALLGREGDVSRSSPEGIEFFCDGVLINDQWILTAAHCFLTDKTFFVRLGEYDYDKVKSIGPQKPLDIKVEQVIPHPDYNGNSGYYDLGLVQLQIKVLFTNSVHPLCLPWGSIDTNHLIDSTVTLTGWGTTYFGGSPSNVLLEANVTIFNPDRCQKSYSKLLNYRTEFPYGMDTRNIICAGAATGGIDACQGDSGGPIISRNTPNEPFTLVGIVSKGHGCGQEEFPGLYAPVSTELWWIKVIAFRDQPEEV